MISSFIQSIQTAIPQINNAIMSSTPMIAFAAEIPHGPAGYVCQFLGGIHGMSFSWWASIIIGGSVIRLALLPFLIKSTITTEKMAIIKVEMDEINAKIRYAQQLNDTASVKQAQKEFSTLLKTNSISIPSMLVAPLVQFPILFLFFRGITIMPKVFSDYNSSHFLWCTLGAPDPFFVLPALSGLFLYLTVQYSSASMAQSGQMKFFMNCMAVFTALVCTRVSTGLCLYWISTSLIGILQNLLLKSDILRRRYHLDPLPLERQFIYQLKSKYFIPPPPTSNSPVITPKHNQRNN